VVAIGALMVVGAVGAAPGSSTLTPHQLRRDSVRPLAAVALNPDDPLGAAVVTVTRPPPSFHIAAATMSAPPPSVVVNSPGALKIPSIVLQAYSNAERMMAAADPACGVSWNLLAGIGRIESMHANGGYVDATGTAIRPILGPLLDGTLPGNEVVVQARSTSGVQYARALGPMQFLPGTWSRFASDGNGDGKADVQNVFDASLAAARYLCSGGLNLRDPGQVMTAVLRYNNSMPYTENVLGWAAAYATGVVPVALPPITGPIPPMGDAHLEGNPEGLGPGLPGNAMELPATDPLALMPIEFGRTDIANMMPVPPGPLDPGVTGVENQLGQPSCTLVCFGPQQPATAAPTGPEGNPAYLPGPAALYQPATPAAQPPTPFPGQFPAPAYQPTAPDAPAPGALPGPPPQAPAAGPAPGPAVAGPPPGPAPDAVPPTQPPVQPMTPLGPPPGPANQPAPGPAN
jgi:membrane-bound lytic murein transglycosylase B